MDQSARSPLRDALSGVGEHTPTDISLTYLRRPFYASLALLLQDKEAAILDSNRTATP